ncbi:MAG: glycoside hydrolase family 127 protein [Oscillospiraceae bacterium]|nr:glycoside hydrolase family 127 protein [Oscillospiraceae bacterium]
MKNHRQINIKNYYPTDGFILNYQRLVKEAVIPYQYEVLHDRAEGAEKSGVIENFKNAAAVLRGEKPSGDFYGMVFQDSDAAKWIEAAAFSLAIFPDEELEKKADELIELIASAQDEDGYLNTRFTISDRDKRWTNLLEGHELYCAGHFMEAAVAYFEATGKRRLLDVMEKNAEHIYEHFIVEGHRGFPGHPEVELALLKLYRATGNKHCLELAEHFLDERGSDKDFYKDEATARDWTVWGNNAEDGYYQQSYAPVREQADAVGHAVRAVYLYTGMADLASVTGDEGLLKACGKLWESIVGRRMYITGGIGSTGIGEAFTVDYDLPNDTAYAESCASVGLMMFASRMLEICPEGKYADIMERAFYNTVLGGMQLDGKRFFYVNPLEVLPGISGCAATHRHDKPERSAWYACACCPPNIARTISSIGKYAYGESEEVCYCHLYAAGEVSFDNGMKIKCGTEYPYGFKIRYEIIKGGKALAVRIPEWSEYVKFGKNGGEVSPVMKNGYAYFEGVCEGDIFEIRFDDRGKFVYPSVKIAENTGCVAIERGPLVYCAEGVDNGGSVLDLQVDDESEIVVSEFMPDMLGGVATLSVGGVRVDGQDRLYSHKKPGEVPCGITLVPYYAWGNRGLGEMRVWIGRK